MKIGYSRDDIRYILEHYRELSSGIWPEPSGSESEGKKPGISSHAPFESPCLVAGEIGARVKLCGQDGMLVEVRYALNGGVPLTDGEMERCYHLPLYEIGKVIKRVIWYCVGSKRGWHKDHEGKYRLMSYQTWLRVNHDRRNIRA